MTHRVLLQRFNEHGIVACKLRAIVSYSAPVPPGRPRPAARPLAESGRRGGEGSERDRAWRGGAAKPPLVQAIRGVITLLIPPRRHPVPSAAVQLVCERCKIRTFFRQPSPPLWLAGSARRGNGTLVNYCSTCSSRGTAASSPPRVPPESPSLRPARAAPDHGFPSCRRQPQRGTRGQGGTCAAPPSSSTARSEPRVTWSYR